MENVCMKLNNCLHWNQSTKFTSKWHLIIAESESKDIESMSSGKQLRIQTLFAAQRTRFSQIYFSHINLSIIYPANWMENDPSYLIHITYAFHIRR